MKKKIATKAKAKKTTTKAKKTAKANPKAKPKTKKRKATTAGRKMKMASRKKPVQAPEKAEPAIIDGAASQKPKEPAGAKGKVVKLRVPNRGGFFPEGESGFHGLEEGANSTRDQFSDNVTPIHAGVHIKQPPGRADI